MGRPIFHVNAFTDRPFAGNPAVVCLLTGPADEAWMQSLAAEMRVSETAYLYPSGDTYQLRWFTPTVEVDLCGHATLAAAHVLWESGEMDPSATARFMTRSGLLSATRDGQWIVMDFPAERESPANESDAVAEALGVDAVYVGKNRFDFLAEVRSEGEVRSARPDLARVADLPCRGVIVTSRASTPEFDFVSRFFAPGSGIDEDPVTGSAHSCLGPYWSERMGKKSLVGYQASSRGGVVRVTVNDDRVLLAGQAVTIFRGELT